MNYNSMSSMSLQPLTSISLPPISSIDLRTQAAYQVPQLVQPLPPPPLPPPPPPPPRQLPPLPYYHNGETHLPQRPDYAAQRPVYAHMQVPSPYRFSPNLVPLPPTPDPNLVVAPTRYKSKEVKRRTKTGCLTCRKRRIKCDEGRPECRNCLKSKRQCLGYDPVFQLQGPHSLHFVPTSLPTSAPPSSSTLQPRRYTNTPTSPSASSHSTSLPTTSPRDRTDYLFPRPSEQLLPHLSQAYKMDSFGQGGMPSRASTSRPRHSVEEICTIAGTKIPSIPAIPPDSVPNLDSIRRVYDIAFAPGLDRFLESNQNWFAREGFNLLANHRALLGLVLAYLTLVSANHDAPLGSNDTLASQEARVTWALLSLCIRPDHDGGEEADKLARKFRALESLLTGEPLTNTSASMSEFVHQEEGDPPVPELKGTAFERQVARRSEEFWRVVESIAVSQGQYKNGGGEAEINLAMEQCRSLTDGMENRDIIYSTVLLGWGKNGDPSSERELAKRYLHTEAGGRATNQVCGTLAGMALRAFES